MKLYSVKPEWLYGDDKESSRTKQLSILDSIGVKECKEGYVVCNAENALYLVTSGYCGPYGISDRVVEITEVDNGDSIREVIAASINASIKAVGDLFNEKIQQEQPNLSLMSVTETLLMEDACTDALQDKITQGWRILAICPQPQRRPDYVLGRNYIPSIAQRG